jgi:amidohydrolase
MRFLREAESLFEYTKALRRDFHRHPELGFQEARTAGIVARQLQELGLEVRTGIAETGVMAFLEGAHPSPVVLLRFDMDALSIQEQSSAEYASTVPGVMHACGHDGHTAVGLTVARLLHARFSELAGSVRFVFQPAEEGLGGAARMVAEGVLEDPRPDACLALHVWNEKPLGWLGVADGPTMAAAEIFTVTLTGKGGHGAAPHLTVDPVVAAAQVISALQSLVSRNVSPLDTAVVSVTMLQAGDAFNVIPATATLQGTIRTFVPAVRARVIERFQQIVEGVAQAMNCQATVDIHSITPAVINDPQIAKIVREAAAELFPGNPATTDFSTMGSEDMAFLMQEIPGCYFFLGSANAEKGLDAPQHHPRFDIDEHVLPRAAALMATAACRLLEQVPVRLT